MDDTRAGLKKSQDNPHCEPVGIAAPADNQAIMGFVFIAIPSGRAYSGRRKSPSLDMLRHIHQPAIRTRKIDLISRDFISNIYYIEVK